MDRTYLKCFLGVLFVCSSVAWGADAQISSAAVEDSGGFDEPYFVEDLNSDPENPTSLELNLKERTDLVQKSALENAEDFTGYVQYINNAGKETVCNVQTKPCEENKWGYLQDVQVIISKFHGKVNFLGRTQNVPETLHFVAYMDGFGWMELFSHPVSTGVKNCGGRDCTTPSGVFPLAKTNGGRLYSTRNHCSGVSDYGKDQGQFIELAPMPYSVHFNGGIAMHTGYTTGTPRSHGCVRQGNQGARLTYCALLEENNWKRATVTVTDDLVTDAVGYVVSSTRARKQPQQRRETKKQNPIDAFIQRLSF